MWIYFSWHADDVEEHQQHASAKDAPDELRRVAQACDFGARLWTDWVEAVGGSIISNSEGSGRAQIPADQVEDLAVRVREYGQLLDSSVSVGVGTSLSEADCALELVLKQGGDQILFYSPETDVELEDMSKAVDDFGGAVGPAGGIESHAKFAHGQGHAGMAAATMPKAPAKNRVEASEHSQGEAAVNQAATDMPPAPEQTHAGQDLIDQFHSLAQQQAQKDSDTAKQQGQSMDQVTQQIVQALQAVKQQAPILEQIKDQAPDLYQAVIAMVGAMVSMAHEMKGPDPENPQSPTVESAAAAPAEGSGSDSDTKKHEADGDKDVGEFMDDLAKCPKCRAHQGLDLHGDGTIGCHGCGHRGPEEEFTHPLAKGKLPMPHAPNYHHLELPAGAEREGKMKVKHGNGAVGWVEVRAGQVLSHDGHTISARNPQGR